MTLPYDPDSDHGRGFLPLIIRAFGHSLFVIGAHFHKWPMTVEQAKAELVEGLQHANAVQDNLNVLSTEGQKHVTDWKRSTQMLIDAFGVAEGNNPEQLIEAHQQALVNYARQTWALTSLLDIELLGLRGNETDAGRLP